MKIGFIGQGWIGKNYADNYEERGYEVVRYSLEKKYLGNKEKIQTCDIVVIAVPTPTTPKGFDYSIVRESIGLAGDASTIVIKSTLLPGTTALLQKEFPEKTIFCNPEFLSERSVTFDVQRPHAHVIGIGENTDKNKAKAELFLKTLPFAPFIQICSSVEAELIKYSRNIHGVFEILFYNMLYDISCSIGADYSRVQEYIKHDPLHVYRYSTPIHASGHDLEHPKRGAGGHCFIKDFKAFKEFFKTHLPDGKYMSILDAIEQKNIDLLVASNKDIDLLRMVYGKDFYI